MTDDATWEEFAGKPMVEHDAFYAEDPRRKTDGHKSFGFDWKDPSVSDPNTFCEVYWYRGTHEIAAVYSTFDPVRLRDIMSGGTVATSAMGLAIGAAPVIGDAGAARALGQWLGDRDLATTSTLVRVMGLLEHPLERYWVLRDALFLETEPDGLLTLQRRIDACAHGDRLAVSSQPSWEHIRELLGEV